MKNIKILAVDDSQSILTMLDHSVKNLPEYEIFLASNGKTALEMAVSIMPDIMLIDLVMPDPDGIDTIRTIRSYQIFKHTPIIVLTSVKDLQPAFDAGADDFVSKPFEMFELLIRINHLIEISRKNHKIFSQNERLNQISEQLQIQQDTLTFQNEEMLDTKIQIERLQQVIFDNQDGINKIANHSFVFNKPLSIIGGDFYWANFINGYKVVAVGDCTGHGISGATLAMVICMQLDKLITNNPGFNAAEILNLLREFMLKVIQNNSGAGEPSNGLDLSLCMIDSENHLINYAGANSPVYLIRKSEDIEIIKADRMPIGIHTMFNQPFTNQTIKYEHDEFLYMLTDGYADQFGGPEQQKYRYKRFQELLIKIHKKPMKEQKHILEQTIEKWKGSLKQVDDMLVLGIRL